MTKLRRAALVAAVAVTALGATGAAFLMRGRRDVTTCSAEAYRLYRLGRENELKLYSREAIEAYAEALKHDPNFVMATLRLADQLRGRDPEKAKSLVQTAIRHRDSVSPKERLIIDIAQADVDRKPERIDQLVDEFGRRFPDDPEAYHLKANRLMWKRKTAEATAELHRLLEVDPNFAFAYNTLGYYAAKDGDLAKAESYLKRYRFLAPEQANPYDSLGEIYIHFGRYEEAEQNLRKALTIKPDFFPSIAHLGTLEVARGNYQAAAPHYFRAAEYTASDGGRFEFSMQGVFSLALAGQNDEAWAAYERLKTEVNGSSEAERKSLERRFATTTVVLLARTGRVAEARQRLDAVLEGLATGIQPTEKEKLESVERERANLSGVVAYYEARYDEAAALLAKGFQNGSSGSDGFSYFPGEDIRRVLLAGALRQLGKHEEAEAALKPVTAHNPRFALAVQELARIKGTAAPESAVAARAGASS